MLLYSRTLFRSLFSSRRKIHFVVRLLQLIYSGDLSDVRTRLSAWITSLLKISHLSIRSSTTVRIGSRLSVLYTIIVVSVLGALSGLVLVRSWGCGAGLGFWV
mgnify:CR=1 FL=1